MSSHIPFTQIYQLIISWTTWFIVFTFSFCMHVYITHTHTHIFPWIFESKFRTWCPLNSTYMNMYFLIRRTISYITTKHLSKLVNLTLILIHIYIQISLVIWILGHWVYLKLKYTSEIKKLKIRSYKEKQKT